MNGHARDSCDQLAAALPGVVACCRLAADALLSFFPCRYFNFTLNAAAAYDANVSRCCPSSCQSGASSGHVQQLWQRRPPAPTHHAALPPALSAPQAVLATLSSQCADKVSTEDLQAALKDKFGKDAWITCNAE